MSAWLTPASVKAAGPDQTAPVYVTSTGPVLVSLVASPWPRILTQVRSSDAATSGLTTISAPPPSVMTQQSSRCNGSLTIGDDTTSSTVTGVRNMALGL